WATRSLLTGEEGNQVDELVCRERLLQSLRHNAARVRLPGFNVGLGHHVLFAVAVTQRQSVHGLREARAAYGSAVLERHHDGLEARGDRAAWIQDRFDDVDAGEAPAHSREFGADLFALLAQAVAFQALRLGYVKEQDAATFRIAGAGQGRLRQAFVL